MTAFPLAFLDLSWISVRRSVLEMDPEIRQQIWATLPGVIILEVLLDYVMGGDWLQHVEWRVQQYAILLQWQDACALKFWCRITTIVTVTYSGCPKVPPFYKSDLSCFFIGKCYR